MGLLDFLFDSEKAEQRRLNKLEDTLTNMYVQDTERKNTIRTLRDMASDGTDEAIEVLLARFRENAPNTTMDLEEKELVYDVLVELGREPHLDVVGRVQSYLGNTEEKINWPLKVLKDRLGYDEMIEVVRELLETCSDGYQQNPEKKQELMLQSSELRDRELAEDLVPFLEDQNETIRFLAVDAVEHQDYDDIIEEPLRARLVEENSLRIVKKLAELFADHPDWTIPEDEQADVEQALPEEYGIHKEGHVYQKRI